MLRPVPDARLSFAKAAFHSPMGMIESGWELEDVGKTIRYSFTVPFGAEADLWLPGESAPMLLTPGRHALRRELP